MSKIKFLLVLMLMAGMVVLFHTSQIMAQDCTLNTSVTSASNAYTLTAVGCGPDDTFPCPVVIDGKTWYQFEYNLNPAEVDHVYIGIPYRCDDEIDIYTGFGGIQYQPPGKGAGGFGEGDFTNRILQVDSDNNRVTYYADRDILGEVSAYFAFGRKNYTGKNSIAGVGRQITEVLTTQYEYDEILSMCVKKELDDDMGIITLWYACFDPRTESCPEDVSDWGDPIPMIELTDFYIGGHSFNVKSPGTIKIGKKKDIYDICPLPEEVSFMEFLGPSVAHAGSCTSYITTTVRGRPYKICLN
jgi:hypothetical protein